jgi:cytidylate kinase
VKYRVISISRTLGAGGEQLGEALAKEFGMRYVDAEIIDRAAQKAGVNVTEVARTEARKGFAQRILEGLGRASVGMSHEYIPDPALMADPHYEQLIVDVIRETAAEGNVVIVAHGSSIPLAGTPGVLRVHVTASEDTRAKRLEAEAHGSAKAKKMVQDSDAARADYFKRFYQLTQELPTHYDMVVNTDVLSISDAQAAIRAVAG